MSNQLLKIIKDLSKEMNFKVNTFCDGWVIQLTKNKQHRYIYGYNFDINNSASSRLCDDKSALFELLNKNHISSVPHFYFMNPNSPWFIKSNWQLKIKQLFSKYKKIVIKPNNGTGGNDVYLTTSESQLHKYVSNIFSKHDSLAVSPYLEIKNEYRLIVLNNKVLLTYKKDRQHNEWRHNLQLGAKPQIISDNKILNKLTPIALKVINLINISFCSIDIVEVENKYYILEVNSGVMMDKFSSISKKNYEISKVIYSKVIHFISDK
ncbi:MAG: ATP-grasp domain-containing protein [Mycoplasmataceae bacterium]|jgi:glutathione synthase/RimK-type ligase-like ATP-grasp enzyme|nr:ATP-grasp domain-containing protein [Mycoplasmataceae bacterium]